MAFLALLFVGIVSIAIYSLGAIVKFPKSGELNISSLNNG